MPTYLVPHLSATAVASFGHDRQEERRWASPSSVSRGRSLRLPALLFTGLLVLALLLGAVLASPAQAGVELQCRRDRLRPAAERLSSQQRPATAAGLRHDLGGLRPAQLRHGQVPVLRPLHPGVRLVRHRGFALGSHGGQRLQLQHLQGREHRRRLRTAAAVFQGWKNSPGHNANMLSANFKVLGVSLVYVSGSPYGSYWTTDFGGYVDPTAHSVGSPPRRPRRRSPPLRPPRRLRPHTTRRADHDDTTPPPRRRADDHHHNRPTTTTTTKSRRRRPQPSRHGPDYDHDHHAASDHHDDGRHTRLLGRRLEHALRR